MIINETSLSFLGLGIRPPAISLGVLLQEAQNIQTLALAPWLLIPGGLVIVAVLAFNLVGDACAMPPIPTATDPLLRVRDLHVSFALDEGTVRAVDGVSFDVFPGQVVGIVGESGCGKSVTMRAILQLIDPPGTITGGEILYRRGETQIDLARLLAARPHDAYAAWRRDRADPARADGGIQPGAHRGCADHRGYHAARTSGRPEIGDAQARAMTWTCSAMSDLDAGAAHRCVFVAAVGRIAAARDDRDGAILQAAPADRGRTDHRDRRDDPGADPGSAARAATQVPDGGHFHHARSCVIARMANYVVVMYLGGIMEEGPVDDIFHAPLHPYTRALLRSIPSLQSETRTALPVIAGTLPHPFNRPPGRPFHPRCEDILPHRCATEIPALHALGPRSVGCFLHSDVAEPA